MSLPVVQYISIMATVVLLMFVGVDYLDRTYYGRRPDPLLPLQFILLLCVAYLNTLLVHLDLVEDTPLYLLFSTLAIMLYT